jgi:hypothetical protein
MRKPLIRSSAEADMRWVIALLMFSVAALCTALQAETLGELAQHYNLEGMRAYRQLDWKTAEKRFRDAVAADSTHKLATYNLACVLALRLSMDRSTWFIGDDPALDPLEYLERAIALDPSAKQKAAHDPDFKSVRLTPRFQMLIGSDLTDSCLVQTILVAQGEWYGPVCGAWCGNHLLFFENGEVAKKVFGEDGDGHGSYTFEKGRYSIEGGVIRIEFESGDAVAGGFIEDGVLQLGRDWYTVFPSHDI